MKPILRHSFAAYETCAAAILGIGPSGTCRSISRIWAVLSCLILTAPAGAGSGDGRLDLYWIDTEGGAATLVVTPAGESVLIDTGNPGTRDASRIVKAVTEAAGLKQIDHLVITHYHGDHYGGALTLVNLLPVRTLYDNGQFESMPDNPGKAYFDLKVDRRHVVQPGMKLPLRQASGAACQTNFTFIGGQKKFIDSPADAPDNGSICASSREKERDGSDNANSVVMVVEFGPWRFYDAGDLTWNQETRLVCPKNLIGQVDVYQVTHHGLDSSNNPLVLRSLQPRVAIMNNGPTKGCLPEVFANLQDTKSLETVYQVHKNLRPDGATSNVPDEYIANKEKECQGNFIKLSVAADGRSYVVSIPASGHSRKFETRR
jgi:beta-lactamase superfamily II metal-dependent hydrolase